jgi:hypothetical protein
MILEFFDGLNWLAIAVATLAWFVFSAIWYSIPPISKAWQAAARVPPQEGPPLLSLMVSTVILYFITAVVIALLVAATGAQTVKDGVALGATLGVGFGVVSGLVSQLYEQKGGSYWLINGINALVAWSIMAVILALWD